MNYELFAHPEWRAFVGSLRRDPRDSTAAMVAADWMQDRGNDEYAEFIRASCKLWSRYTVEAIAARAWEDGVLDDAEGLGVFTDEIARNITRTQRTERVVPASGHRFLKMEAAREAVRSGRITAYTYFYHLIRAELAALAAECDTVQTPFLSRHIQGILGVRFPKYIHNRNYPMFQYGFARMVRVGRPSWDRDMTLACTRQPIHTVEYRELPRQFRSVMVETLGTIAGQLSPSGDISVVQMPFVTQSAFFWADGAPRVPGPRPRGRTFAESFYLEMYEAVARTVMLEIVAKLEPTEPTKTRRDRR